MQEHHRQSKLLYWRRRRSAAQKLGAIRPLESAYGNPSPQELPGKQRGAPRGRSWEPDRIENSKLKDSDKGGSALFVADRPEVMGDANAVAGNLARAIATALDWSSAPDARRAAVSFLESVCALPLSVRVWFEVCFFFWGWWFVGFGPMWRSLAMASVNRLLIACAGEFPVLVVDGLGLRNGLFSLNKSPRRKYWDWKMSVFYLGNDVTIESWMVLLDWGL